jgi:hypothetical protein
MSPSDPRSRNTGKICSAGTNGKENGISICQDGLPKDVLVDLCAHLSFRLTTYEGLQGASGRTAACGSTLPVCAMFSPTPSLKGYPSFTKLKSEVLGVRSLGNTDGEWFKRQHLAIDPGPDSQRAAK